jgi:DNA-directed RNA polymerase subunit N (RpoN/RPB10)
MAQVQDQEPSIHTEEEWNRYLESLDPKERDEFLNFVNPECHTCGTVIGHLYEVYKHRLENGERPEDIFKSFKLSYCCSASLAHPARIAAGLIYNNPKTRDKVEFATKSAERLLAEHTIRDGGPLPSIRSGVSSSGRETLEVSIAPDLQRNERTTSTPLPTGVTFEDLQVEINDDAVEPENATLDGSYFTTEFNEKGIPLLLGKETPPSSTSRSRPSRALPMPKSLRNTNKSYISSLGPREIGQGALASDSNISQFFNTEERLLDLERFEERVKTGSTEKPPSAESEHIRDTTAFVFLPQTITTADPLTGEVKVTRRFEV